MAGSPAPALVHVVAMARNWVIGRDGGLPWHISADLKYFKRVTLGKPVVMGRKTYESIGRPLPGRHNIVVTRNPAFQAEGVVKAESLAAALAEAEAAAEAVGAEEISVIGGGEIFAATLDRAERLYVTEIAAAPAGDTYFPEIDPAAWREVSRESVPPGSETEETPGYAFVVYERR